MTLLSHAADVKIPGRLSDRICVSVYGKNISELKRNVKRAMSVDPGYIELRLDYIPAILRRFVRLSEIDRPKNRIFTFRSYEEGGHSRISDESRIRILLEIVSKLDPPIVDIEIETLRLFPEVSDLVFKRLSFPAKTDLIASSHNFQKTEDRDGLEDLVLGAVKKYSPRFVKVVRHANEFSDNLVILSLYKLRERIKPTELIAFCTGSLGVFSRIACVSYGSPFTFASLPGRETASGQLDVNDMKTLLDSWTVARN